MKKYYIHMFGYNDWANEKILNVLKDNPGVNTRIFFLFSHVIISQILWLNRVKKDPYEYKDFWQILKIEEMNKLYKRSSSDWISFIRGQDEDGLSAGYSYFNSKGVKYTNTLAQIMTHVINHSTYHRAQIATLLREENIQPPLTDYIAFFR